MNASINSVPVENRPAHKSLLGISMTYLIHFKISCQKSFAIRADGVSFQIICACFALAAILGHYAAYILKKVV